MNELTKTTSRFDPIEDIFKDEDKLAILTNFVDEDIKCQAIESTQKSNRKALRAMAVEQLNIDPVLYAEYVRTCFNNDFLKQYERSQQKTALHTLLCEKAGVAIGNS